MSLYKFKNSTVTLMAVIIFSKLLGMLRDVVLANYYGTSNISDAYLVAVSVPTLVFYFIGHSLSTAYLPMYNKVKAEKGEKEALHFSNNLLTVSLTISSLLIGLLIVYPQGIVKIFASGFDEETIKIASNFIKSSAFSLYFMTVISIWTGYLQAKKNYIVPASVSVPRNVVIMLSIVLSVTLGTQVLGYGLLLAYVSEFVLFLPFIYKTEYKYKPVVELKSTDLQETLYIVLPVLLGTGINQINHIIDKNIASSLVEGGISALSYASIINNAVQEVLVTGIITILFAQCARWVADGRHEEVRKKLFDTISTMIVVLLPASMGVFVLAKPIVITVLGRGKFDQKSAELTTGVLCCYTLGLMFLAIRDVLVKVFYAYRMTSTVTATSIISIVFAVVLKLVLSHFYNVTGVALATSIAAMIHCTILLVLLRKKIGDFGTKPLIKVLLKALIASLIMFVSLKIFDVLVQINSPMIMLAIQVFIGGVIYAIVALILRIPFVLDIIRKILKRKLGD